MRKLLYISLLSSIILCMQGCGGNGSTALTKEQQDSIATAKADSIRMADSILAIEKAKADSIARINAKEKEERIAKISKNFREKKDEFSDFAWVEHKTTTPYRNRNSIHLSFQKDNNGNVQNLRFVIQYEADDWLFIRNMIFNIDGDNVTFIPNDMERDNDYGRIWEWSDEPASLESSLVEKIANAKSVKVKFNGDQYYDTRTMSSKQIEAFKQTLDYYKALGGSL